MPAASFYINVFTVDFFLRNVLCYPLICGVNTIISSIIVGFFFFLLNVIRKGGDLGGEPLGVSFCRAKVVDLHISH